MSNEVDADEAPLRLRSLSRTRIGLGLSLLVGFGILFAINYWRYGGWRWWDLAYFGLMAAICLFFLVAGLIPTELTADRVGLRWRQFFHDRTFRWADIESIGVARNRAFDGYDRPVVRALTNRGVPKIEPMIGINLKIGDRDAATVSYRRGASGYELNFPSPFDVGLTALVEDLQRRLEQARQSLDD